MAAMANQLQLGPIDEIVGVMLNIRGQDTASY
jgi:hypothetical protein